MLKLNLLIKYHLQARPYSSSKLTPAKFYNHEYKQMHQQLKVIASFPHNYYMQLTY